MRLRIYLLGNAIAALVVGLSLSPSTSAAGSCDERACYKVLVAKQRAQIWKTPQRFGRVAVVVSVQVEGRLLGRRFIEGGCGAVYGGGAVKVTVRVCGRGAVPIRFVYRSLKESRVPLTVAYESS